MGLELVSTGSNVPEEINDDEFWREAERRRNGCGRAEASISLGVAKAD